MLRSTNFHTFSSGNDWGYSGKKSRKLILKLKFFFLKEFLDGNYLNSRRNDLLTDDRLRVYVRVILVDEKETTASDIFHHPPPPQQTNSTIPKLQPSASSSLASSSSTTSIINVNPSNASSTSSQILSGLFTDDKERFKSFEILSNQIKTLLDDERFIDVHIHIIPKQENINDDHKKLNRIKQPSCSSCHCLTNNEDHHEQSLSGKN
jgi:hypothetical protein